MDHKEKFTHFIQQELNEQQREAVLCDAGPILVVAGAGSGKTRLITARITHLLVNKQVDPASIVALTFTNKAAQEMRLRVSAFIGSNVPLPFIGTFHSYCVYLLKRNVHYLNMSAFSIIDVEDQKKIITAILKRYSMQKKYTAKSIISQISYFKSHALDIEKEVKSYITDLALFDVYKAYEKEKQESQSFDFDDLLHKVLSLFKKNCSFKQQFQETISHILIDEYQDTNGVQRELLMEMAKEKDKLVLDSICAVGDEDQSIYSWRGATIENILHFRKDFDHTKIIKIEQNYRSVQSILSVANQIIAHNTQRNEKKLWSDKKGNDRIRMLATASQYQEADVIAQMLIALRQKNKKSTIGILYRTHTQSRVLEEVCIRHAIPYRIIGGIQFYARKEIKDLLAYMRLIANPFDRAMLFRVLNVPLRGLGEKVEECVYERWKQEPFLTFIQVIEKIIDDKQMTAKKVESLKQFIAIFAGLSASDDPSTTLKCIVDRSGYIQYLKETCEPDEAQDRVGHINELYTAVAHLESEGIKTVDDFVQEVALLQDLSTNNKKSDTENPVLLMTLHAAKGLEFDTVILAGLEEGILPSSRSLHSSDAIEEERRLFYVGVTRARERLFITHAKFRHTYGAMTQQDRSQFLDEVPSRLVSVDDSTYWGYDQIEQYVANWLGVTQTQAAVQIQQSRPKRVKAAQSKHTTRSPKSVWKKNTPVNHKVYGVGIVQSVEQKSSDVMHITVKFKVGLKKIRSDYLSPV